MDTFSITADVFLAVYWYVGSSTNGDGDGNENAAKKQQV